MQDKQGVSAQAAELGFDPAALGRVASRVAVDVQAGKYDGARIMVARRGKVALDLTIGYAERDKDRMLKPDSVFSIMSISKVMTAVALLRCMERGDVSLLTPVAQVIPEFGRRGKERVTIGQVLTHTAGLGMAQAPLPVDQLGDLDKAVAAICDLPLESTPGEIVSYSAMMGFTVLAGVVRRLDPQQRPFRTILQEDLFQPLKMADSSFGLPPRLAERRVPVVVRDDDAPELNRNFLAARDKGVTETTELASGGATFSTAQDLVRFAEMLRLGGALDGARILSPATVRAMVQNQTGDKPNSMMNSSRALHGMPAFPAYLGLGTFLRGEGIFPSHMPILATPGTFGGWGLGSMGFWVDPERELTFVALTSGIMERIRNLLRFQCLGDMVLAAMVE